VLSLAASLKRGYVHSRGTLPKKPTHRSIVKRVANRLKLRRNGLQLQAGRGRIRLTGCEVVSSRRNPPRDARDSL
jgi:hypothetical protein